MTFGGTEAYKASERSVLLVKAQTPLQVYLTSKHAVCNCFFRWCPRWFRRGHDVSMLRVQLRIPCLNVLPSCRSTVTVTRTVTVSTCPTAPPACSSPITLNVSFRHYFTCFLLSNPLCMQFDDINCPSTCPFPSIYKSFVFNGASGWQVVNKAALPATNNQNLAVVSQPNALQDQSSGFVDFGSTGQGFTFDVVRFSFSTFIAGSTSPQTVTFLMNGVTFDGSTRSYVTTLSSGINIGPVSGHPYYTFDDRYMILIRLGCRT